MPSSISPTSYYNKGITRILFLCGPCRGYITLTLRLCPGYGRNIPSVNHVILAVLFDEKIIWRLHING
jgi:hypothetical protein